MDWRSYTSQPPPGNLQAPLLDDDDDWPNVDDSGVPIDSSGTVAGHGNNYNQGQCSRNSTYSGTAFSLDPSYGSLQGTFSSEQYPAYDTQGTNVMYPGATSAMASHSSGFPNAYINFASHGNQTQGH